MGTGKFHSSYIGYVAPPMRMGAWLMACMLRQRIECSYDNNIQLDL